MLKHQAKYTSVVKALRTDIEYTTSYYCTVVYIYVQYVHR